MKGIDFDENIGNEWKSEGTIGKSCDMAVSGREMGVDDIRFEFFDSFFYLRNGAIIIKLIYRSDLFKRNIIHLPRFMRYCEKITVLLFILQCYSLCMKRCGIGKK